MGDLNFTLSLKEVRGQNPHQDPMESFFSCWLEKHHLLDMPPKKLSHTWSNGRKGSVLVAKLLDHFFYFISEGMLEKQWEILSRVAIGGLSYHFPIVLEVSKGGSSRPLLMKFNHRWLKEEAYRKLVGDSWIPLFEDSGESYMHQFDENLGKIKKITISWAKEYTKKQSAAIVEVESKLGSLLIEREARSLSEEEELLIKELMIKKQDLLRKEEST
jgi:hypothetical protein